LSIWPIFNSWQTDMSKAMQNLLGAIESSREFAKHAETWEDGGGDPRPQDTASKPEKGGWSFRPSHPWIDAADALATHTASGVVPFVQVPRSRSRTMVGRPAKTLLALARLYAEADIALSDRGTLSLTVPAERGPSGPHSNFPPLMRENFL